jgi:hypothetical protein
MRGEYKIPINPSLQMGRREKEWILACARMTGADIWNFTEYSLFQRIYLSNVFYRRDMLDIRFNFISGKK